MDKKPLVQLKPIKPSWVKQILKDREEMRKEYENRRLNYFIKIAKGSKEE